MYILNIFLKYCLMRRHGSEWLEVSLAKLYFNAEFKPKHRVGTLKIFIREDHGSVHIS